VTVSEPVQIVVSDAAAPVAVDDAYSVDQFGALDVAAPGVLANDAGAVGRVLTAVLVDAPLHGTVQLAADGSFTYAPDPGFIGVDTFTYRVEGDTPFASGPATVTITVTEVVLTFELPLAAGWNLISVPIMPLDPEVNAVLQGVAGGTAWEVVGGVYRSAQQILPLHGYWVFVETEGAVLVVSGHAVLNPVRHVMPGWTLVGVAAPPPYAGVTPAWLARPEGLFTPPAYGYWNDSYHGVIRLDCGFGYWLNVRREDDLTRGEPLDAAGAALGP